MGVDFETCEVCHECRLDEEIRSFSFCLGVTQFNETTKRQECQTDSIDMCDHCRDEWKNQKGHHFVRNYAHVKNVTFLLSEKGEASSPNTKKAFSDYHALILYLDAADLSDPPDWWNSQPDDHVFCCEGPSSWEVEVTISPGCKTPSTPSESSPDATTVFNCCINCLGDELKKRKKLLQVDPEHPCSETKLATPSWISRKVRRAKRKLDHWQAISDQLDLKKPRF